jgi:hypothetical protein
VFCIYLETQGLVHIFVFLHWKLNSFFFVSTMKFDLISFEVYMQFLFISRNTELILILSCRQVLISKHYAHQSSSPRLGICARIFLDLF